jgi:hypothetical protein
MHSGFSEVKAYSLVSSSDILAMVSIIRTQDGAGLLKDPKVTYLFIKCRR